jgi:hypothetical protein
METALARHDLSDALPRKYELALPRDDWHPRISKVIRWHSFDRATFDIGRTVISIDSSTTIGLYDAQRSIVDAFGLRSVLGPEVANEALRRWLRAGGQPCNLIRVATAFPRAMPALMNAMEILL